MLPIGVLNDRSLGSSSRAKGRREPVSPLANGLRDAKLLPSVSMDWGRTSVIYSVMSYNTLPSKGWRTFFMRTFELA